MDVRALDVVGNPELRETLLLVRARPQPVSIREVAAATGVHHNVARRRLERLTEAGLLTTRFERPSGRTGPGAGRPAKVYSPAVETSTIEFPERRYAELVGLLADGVSKRRLREVGIRFGTALAARAGIERSPDRRAALTDLCTAVSKLGFQARLVHVEDGRAEIVTPTCPLRPLVVVNPVVAEIDHAMWRGLAACAVDDLGVEDVCCETHDCLEPGSPCRIVLRLRSQTLGTDAS